MEPFPDLRGNIAPALEEALLRLRLGPEWSHFLVEVVRPQDVQIYDGAEAEFVAPVQRLVQEVEGLRVGLSVGREQLFFIDGQTQMVQPQSRQEGCVLTQEHLATFRAAPSALGQPVGDVGAPAQGEWIARQCGRRGTADSALRIDGELA